MTPRAKEKYTLRMGGSGGLSRHAKAGCLFLFLTLAFLGLGLFAEDVEAKKAQVKDKRAAGTLLLNMLTMNEAQNLDRTLPVWAKIIDYWIIGIDRKNSDNSEEVIRKHVGHIPGEIVVVDFDGMGPTWTVLVKRGIEAFPGATHGIIADADFTPLVNTLDKRDLDVLCSKHLYHVIEADRTGTRTIDWMYRNIPGARVERRTHQIVQVPGIPGQPEYQRVIPFTVEEYAGGWGDRAGNKSGKYIEWLMKDLEELPGDSRTIYYQGKPHPQPPTPNPKP
ncbi:hypothetical protein T484DRAFT_3126600 [Baffinella frigidus]|nr:hypothetical protein T484DRAFT_3126600 [Cryptophyta sp. CCMP2293]